MAGEVWKLTIPVFLVCCCRCRILIILIAILSAYSIHLLLKSAGVVGKRSVLKSSFVSFMIIYTTYRSCTLYNPFVEYVICK